MPIGNQILKKRNILKLKQKELAEKVGVRQNQLSGIETGRIKRIPETLLRKFAKALQEDVSYFYEEEPKAILPTTQNLPLILIQLHIEPKHIEIVEKAIKRLVKEFHKEKSKKGGGNVKKNFGRSTDFNDSD